MTQEAPNHYFQGVPSEMKICQTQVSPIGHTTTPSSMYIVPVLSSPLCVWRIARSFCVGGRDEQNFEDCPHRRRRVDRSSSRRAVFDSRQSVPPHH